MISEHAFSFLLLLRELPVQLAPRRNISCPFALSFALFWDKWMIRNMSRNPESREGLWKPTALFLRPPHHVVFVSWTIGGNKVWLVYGEWWLFQGWCWALCNAVSKPHGTPTPKRMLLCPHYRAEKTETQEGMITYPVMLLGKGKARIWIQNWLGQNSVPISLCWIIMRSDWEAQTVYWGTWGSYEGEFWARPTWPRGPGNLLGVENTLGKFSQISSSNQ